MKRMYLLVFLIASLLLAACGGGGDTTTSQTTGPAGGGTEATTAAGGGTEATTAAGGGTGTEATTAAGAGTTAETATAAGDADMAETATAAGGAAMDETATAAGAGAAGTTTAAGGAATGGAAMAKVEDCTPAGPVVDRLIWWTRVAEGDPYWDHIQTIAQSYAENGGSPIEVVTVIDEEFRNKVSLAAPAGEGPDIMGPVAHDWVGEFALQQIALEVPEANFTEDVFLEAALNGVTIDGKRYGMPLFVESVALIRNPDVMPTEAQTWEELITQATEQTEGDNVGFIFPALEQYHTYGIIRGFGGYIFKYENGQYDTSDIGLNNEGAVEGFKFLRDLVHNQPFFPDIERASMHDVSNGKMEAGQGGATIQGPWALAGLQKAGIPYDVDVLPTLPNGEPTKPFAGVQVYVASAYSKNQEAALDLLKFVTCSDSVIEMYKGEPKTPARQDVLGEEPIASDQFQEVWRAQAEVAEPLPNIPQMANVWKAWGDAIDAAVLNNAPDEEIQGILDTAVEQIEAEISRAQQ